MKFQNTAQRIVANNVRIIAKPGHTADGWRNTYYFQRRDFQKLVGHSICTIKFRKKDGTERTLNGRIGVAKYVKGTANVQRPDNIQTVYDLQAAKHETDKAKGYRSFDINRLISVTVGGREWIAI